ncbi:hypothetical protein Hanom_Chr04g00307591 [Helianthus anomalus]
MFMFVHLTKQTKFLVCVCSFIKLLNTERFMNVRFVCSLSFANSNHQTENKLHDQDQNFYIQTYSTT